MSDSDIYGSTILRERIVAAEVTTGGCTAEVIMLCVRIRLSNEQSYYITHTFVILSYDVV